MNDKEKLLLRQMIENSEKALAVSTSCADQNLMEARDQYNQLCRKYWKDNQVVVDSIYDKIDSMECNSDVDMLVIKLIQLGLFQVLESRFEQLKLEIANETI